MLSLIRQTQKKKLELRTHLSITPQIQVNKTYNISECRYSVVNGVDFRRLEWTRIWYREHGTDWGYHTPRAGRRVGLAGGGNALEIKIPWPKWRAQRHLGYGIVISAFHKLSHPCAEHIILIKHDRRKKNSPRTQTTCLVSFGPIFIISVFPRPVFSIAATPSIKMLTVSKYNDNINKTRKKRKLLTNGPNDASGVVWAHFLRHHPP